MLVKRDAKHVPLHAGHGGDTVKDRLESVGVGDLDESFPRAVQHAVTGSRGNRRLTSFFPMTLVCEDQLAATILRGAGTQGDLEL